MGAVWCVLAGLMLVDADDQQKIGYSVKAQVIRHYVAFFELATTVAYKKRTLMDSSQDANWDRPDMYEALVSKIPIPMDHEIIQVFNFPTSRLPRRFLTYDVFMVRRGISDSKPYKIGIDDQFNIVRFYGFYEENTWGGLVLTKFSYDDWLDFSSKDVPVEDPKKMEEFVSDWVHLTQFNDHPNFFRILSNVYQLENGHFLGICTTAELHHGPLIPKGTVVYKLWKYKIPNEGTPVLKELSREVRNDLHELFDRTRESSSDDNASVPSVSP